MPDTADYPNAVLGHAEMTRWTPSTSTYTTWYTPLQFPRPETGVIEYQVKCSYCGRVVRWRVLSAARASMRRWSWVWLMVLCVAAFLVGIKVGNYQTGGPYGPEPYAGQGALLAVAAAVVFIIAGTLLIVERGVRVRPRRYHRAARPRSGMEVVKLPAAPSTQSAPLDLKAGSEPAAENTDG
jgi:hypothetical protein